MKLKLILEQTGQSWTLKPVREYIIGSSQDCDISLPFDGIIGDRHLKLSFDETINSWRLYDLGSPSGTFVNRQQVTEFVLDSRISIGLGNNIFITAIPEEILFSQTASQNDTPPSKPVSSSYSRSDYRNDYNETTSTYFQQRSRSKFSPIQILSWKSFVAQQLVKQTSPWTSLATWFHMITGYRNTPWIRSYSEGSSANNFNAFEGYVIPNFKGSVETVVAEIQDKVGSLRQYENTDCFVARLTDAHIADSATQRFFGVELFPIVRGSGYGARADYRDFLVTSYNRVRTYLLIEKYGTDLFVSWITRFEPEPTSLIIILWLIFAIFLTMTAFSTKNFFFVVLPLILWLEVYWAVPKIMESLNIVPKRANANLIAALVIIPTLFVLLSGAGYVVARSYFGSY